MGEYAEDVVLLDVCPFSLGIAVDNPEKHDDSEMFMSKVIERGTKLPCKKVKYFKPADDYTFSILFQVFEGESRYIKNNYPLGKFTLSNIPKKKKEKVLIALIFELDEDSILTVTAIEEKKKSTNSIVIKNDKGGLSRNEIEKVIIKQENETIGKDLEPAMILERNYKNEITKLFSKINSLTDSVEQIL